MWNVPSITIMMLAKAIQPTHLVGSGPALS